MNLQHLRYAVEIEKTTSITKAAESLMMGQPNLSRAIKELEQSLGIVIFRRTSKGIVPTKQGEEFLGFAKSILQQVDQVETYYLKDRSRLQSFSVSAPRASYISDAFISLVSNLDFSRSIDINYRETNNMRVIRNLVEEGYDLGIIRYMKSYKRYFELFLKERELKSRPICCFRHSVLLSRQHPLADKPDLSIQDFKDCIEIVLGDPFIPTLTISDVKKLELADGIDKRIFIYERGSQFDLLSRLPNTFMRTSPIPERLLSEYGLILRTCEGVGREYEDLLIFHKNHHFTPIENAFLEELSKSVERTILQKNEYAE